ncbi:MAG: DNA-directed RNA polymerase subunit A' [Aigarchaeota archaeon]|nr:DNA-directed RNA polymerase subunit A' [Aigarchaeota archaeon]
MSFTGGVAAVRFGVLSPDTIRKMSVAQIQTPDTYDEDGVPIPTGVMDPRLGTLEPGQRCRTCGNTYLGCPGHFGHIELPVPVIHVGFVKIILKLLRSTCRSCGRILLSDDQASLYRAEIEALKKEDKPTAQVFYQLKQRAMAAGMCFHCGEKQLKLDIEKPTTIIEITDSGPVALSPNVVRARLERILDEDLVLLDVDPVESRPEWMVLQVLPVPPVYVRPSITLESGFRSEDDLTHKLVDILRVAQRLKENIAAGSPSPVVAELSDLLQYHLTTYFNNEALGTSPSTHRSGRILKTLAQRLKGKEGRFRLNLSGKRVDFSSRTVISPDPNIRIDEVGVPARMAQQLTVPVTVTSWNIENMRQYVRNGPDKYPGSRYVIRPDGKRIRLRFVSDLEELAASLEPGFVVERHLQDGDIVLFNRQPSLHRMSIMAHAVKVLPYKTFRLNLCVCPPYNADFDGDEMNLHVPQSEEAQVEARVLLLVQNNILSPRFGGPIIGAIRDFITAMFLLTRKGTLLDKNETSLLLSSIEYDGDLPEPAVKEPEPRWSGKQIFSLILPEGFNHRFRSSYCAKCKTCLEEDCPYDQYVTIKNGQLLAGVIDRNAIGVERTNSILHRIALEYGFSAAKSFLDKVSRMATTYLGVRGFTFSLSDVHVPERTYRDISKMFSEMDQSFLSIMEKHQRGEIQRQPGETLQESLESAILSLLSESRNAAGTVVRKSVPEDSSSVIMSRTGARGTTLNIDQMIATVGQQAVRRERIQRGFGQRVLSFFERGDRSPRARGFIYNSFVTGLDPVEFFFHAVGGRDGLVDTAVRTQQSGYMQRRLINALESLYVEYDGTVRAADDDKIVQFKYGEDGVDPAKSYHGRSMSVDLLVQRAQADSKTAEPASEQYVEGHVDKIKDELPESLSQPLVKALLKSKASRTVVRTALKQAVEDYRESTVEPGDPVGIVTAQSIGEPGTQMTLRTFHFAGVREQSILLGLPRLIEIVDARKTPSTPQMRIYLDSEHRRNRAKAESLAKQLTYVTMREIASECAIDLDKNAVLLRLNDELMQEREISMEKVKEALQKYHTEIRGRNVYITPPETSLEALEKVRDKVLLQRVRGMRRIARTMLTRESGEYVIYTEGSNLKEVVQTPGVDATRVETNDVQEIASVLGIEAARRAIINEARQVLREQGMDVDIRHLLLLADVMTASGKEKQVGRHGVVKLKSSVLARAAFEISVQTLLDAAAKGELDPLRGNVERILVGKEIPVGTGMVNMLMSPPAKVTPAEPEG